MTSLQSIKDRLERRIAEAVDPYRSLVLDIAEQEIGDKPAWPYLRNRLLKAFGDRGLAGRIREVLETEFTDEGRNQ